MKAGNDVGVDDGTKSLLILLLLVLAAVEINVAVLVKAMAVRVLLHVSRTDAKTNFMIDKFESGELRMYCTLHCTVPGVLCKCSVDFERSLLIKIRK